MKEGRRGYLKIAIIAKTVGHPRKSIAGKPKNS
jgi:hypothetical protein